MVDYCIRNEDEIKIQTDWANHDHCGGELCQLPNLKISDDKKETVKIDENYVIPFVIES